MKNTTLLVIGLLTFLNLAFAQKVPTIVVEGNSEIMIIPDEATIHITVQKKAIRVDRATQELNAATKKIVDSFKQSDLQSYDLTAGNYFVNVNRIYQKGTAKDSGYIASQNLKIKIKDLEKELSKAVEMINLSGDQSIHVDFGISKEMEKSYKDQLLESALMDAQGKANNISRIMNLKNIKVQKVQYSTDQGAMPFYQMKSSNMRLESADARVDPIFMPEEQQLSDKILVTFIFEN